MQLTDDEIKEIADWFSMLPNSVQVTQFARAIESALSAQADARPVAWYDRATGNVYPLLGEGERYAAGVRQLEPLYTHPVEAAALGLSKEALHYLRMGRENLRLKNGVHNIDFDRAEAILTRASAATVAEPSLPNYEEMAEALSSVAHGACCPLCGWDYPHEHSPREITIYRNGVKFARQSTKPWAGEDDQGIAEVAPNDAGRTGEARGAGTHEYHEHRSGQANADQQEHHGDSGGVGLRGACELSSATPVAAQQQAENLARSARIACGMEPMSGFKPQPLGAEFDKVLHDNLSSLYIEDGKQQANPGADERATVAERCAGFAELYKTDHACGREAEEACDAIADACRTYAPQSGQRAGVAEPEGWREFITEVAQQKPEKPDHWSPCGQCRCNADRAQDLIDAALTQTQERAGLAEDVVTRDSAIAAIYYVEQYNGHGRALDAIDMLAAPTQQQEGDQ